MKNILQLFLIILLSGATFISCDDDVVTLEKTDPKTDDPDNSPDSNNFIQYGDIKIELADGFVSNFGVDTDPKDYDGYNLELNLFTEGITYEIITNDNDEIIDYEIDGDGTSIYASFYSESFEYLQDGTYNFDEDSDIINVFHFDECDFDYNYISTTDEGESFYIIDGTYTISYLNENYTIDFDLVLENEETITGHFEGKLQYFDLSD